MKRFFNDLTASVLFYTRLPLHRIYIPPQESFTRILPFGALMGWLVGGLSALIWWLSGSYLPVGLSVVLALAGTVMFTGALHEDGFADFIDGFGGGITKEKILAIMKDSHIGTYGVIGLVLLFAVRYELFTGIDTSVLPGAFISGAVVGRYVGTMLPSTLPYARTVESSKIQVGLVPMGFTRIIVTTLIAGATCYGFFGYSGLIAMAVALLSLPVAAAYIKHKIGGYTGDCCGMLIVTAELVWLLALRAVA